MTVNDLNRLSCKLTCVFEGRAREWRTTSYVVPLADRWQFRRAIVLRSVENTIPLAPRYIGRAFDPTTRPFRIKPGTRGGHYQAQSLRGSVELTRVVILSRRVAGVEGGSRFVSDRCATRSSRPNPMASGDAMDQRPLGDRGTRGINTR